MRGYLHSLLGLHARRDANSVIDQNAAPPNLSTLANNSLFEVWRPRAHVLPPSNHVGDPCMHYVDPATGLFHVGYLYSSQAGASGVAAGITDDLVTYRDVNPGDPRFIQPGGINDPIAVFDGSVVPSGINGTPTLLYTSVSYLPISWTIPYTKGSETQSLAVTYDGGKNFTKVREGPVIPGPPHGSLALNVTGFRDPYVFQNQKLDDLLDSKNGTWYAAISGGVHDVGPSQFLYRQHNPEFRDWEYLGEWWYEPANSTWGNGTWAGRWGFNFECGNVFTLSESGYDAQGDLFTTLGTEGGNAPVPSQTSPNRDMLWTSGNVTRSADGKVHFEPSMAGRLDWGLSSYAAAGKIVPASSQASKNSKVTTDRFIIYLWLTNNAFGTNGFPVNQQGWDSTLLSARELSIGYLQVVDNYLVSANSSWRVVSRQARSKTVQLATLKQRIVREAYDAFVTNATHTYQQPGRTIGEAPAQGFSSSVSNGFDFTPKSKFYMLTASIQFPASARCANNNVKAGFSILSSVYESTRIYYQFSNESIVIDRSNSSAASNTTPGILNYNEAGKHRLFDIWTQGHRSSKVETLNLTILVDNSVVEVYANDRFALSTWSWSWYNISNQISFYHEGSSDVEFGPVTVYEGLVDAWPERAR